VSFNSVTATAQCTHQYKPYGACIKKKKSKRNHAHAYTHVLEIGPNKDSLTFPRLFISTLQNSRCEQEIYCSLVSTCLRLTQPNLLFRPAFPALTSPIQTND